MASSLSAMDTTNATMSIEERIQRLAQELKDIVFDFYVLTVPSEQTIDITNTYQAPKQLQINNASRRTAAKHYYSSNTFIIYGFDKTSPTNSFDQSSTTIRWLKNLPAEHSFMIETLSLPKPFEYMELVAPETNLRYRYDWIMESLEESSGSVLRDNCLEMGFSIAWVNGKEVMIYGKRDELADKLAKLLFERARTGALEVLVNRRKEWIEV